LTQLQEPLSKDPSGCRALADAWKLLERVPGLAYSARYEQARSLWQAGQRDGARMLFQDLYTQTLKDGVLPPLDAAFREALQGDGKADLWSPLMRQAAGTLIADKRRPAIIALAWQCRQLDDPSLGDALIGIALERLTDDSERLATSLAAIEYYWQSNQYEPIDKVLQPLLASPAFAARPSLWRLSAMLYQERGMKAKSSLSLERALDIEYQQPPAILNVQAVRNDYGALLAQYQQESQTLAARKLAPSRDFLAKVIRTADRWRTLDRDNTTACQLTAKILETLGAHEIAWEYLTTPVGARPNEAAPWLSLAQTLNRDREWTLADRAYAAAFEAEATNPQILWDRARNLQQAGKNDESRKLVRQIADGQWQPRFASIQAQARRLVEGR
jgi:predicted Zn-dependent protease